MENRPNIANDTIIQFLKTNYELSVHEIIFLPLGADFATAVFKVKTTHNKDYFLKFRSNTFHEASVRLPQFLYEQGISEVIPIIKTTSGKLFGKFKQFHTILYPFVKGKDAYETPLTKNQWTKFARALKNIHSAKIPKDIHNLIAKESFSNFARVQTKNFLKKIKVQTFSDPLTQKVSELLLSEQRIILELIARIEELEEYLVKSSLDPIVCHSDLHAGNLHITPSGDIYIVDWDQPLLAPKEKDLMYIGAGLLNSGLTPSEEEYLFFREYGKVALDHRAIAYYRYTRIIQDVYEYCTMFFDEVSSSEVNKKLYFKYLEANFLPGGCIEIAINADKKNS